MRREEFEQHFFDYRKYLREEIHRFRDCVAVYRQIQECKEDIVCDLRPALQQQPTTRHVLLRKVISGVIGFQPLSDEQLAKILDQIIAEKSRMFEAEKGLRIKVDQLARKALLDRGYSPDLGARPLERAVDEMIVQPLVDAWFGNRLRTGTVQFSASGENTITFSQD